MIKPYTILNSLPTNGVLRCITGEIPSGNTAKEVISVGDVLTTVQRVFNYSDSDLAYILKSKNPLTSYILPLSAGKKLEVSNPELVKLKQRVLNAQADSYEIVIDKIISEIGEHIDLKI